MNTYPSNINEPGVAQAYAAWLNAEDRLEREEDHGTPSGAAAARVEVAQRLAEVELARRVDSIVRLSYRIEGRNADEAATEDYLHRQANVRAGLLASAHNDETRKESLAK